MKRYEAYITKGWRDTGLSNVLVARIDDDDYVTAGGFLVDHLCLGVKDAFYVEDLTEDELREMIEERFPDGELERMHPAWAKKFVEGAVAYAESFGFAPHRDYRKAKRVLGGIDASVCTETFTYGEKGRPHYMQGGMDDDERTERVLGMLDSRLGPDGFSFTSRAEMLENPGISDEDLANTRKRITRALENMGSGYTVHMVAGIITAMLCHPGVFTADDALDTFREDRDENGKPFAEHHISNLGALLEIYWAQLACLLEVEMDDDDPWPFDFYQEDFSEVKEYIGALIQWVCGFMDIVDVYENVWVLSREQPGLEHHWEILEQWGNPEGPGGLFEKVKEHAAKAKAGEEDSGYQSNPRAAVVAIYRALREEEAAEEETEADEAKEADEAEEDETKE